MHKRILFISGNYTPEQTGIGKYNGEMINWLSKHGFECTVITTYPYYPYWSIQDPYKKKSFWFTTEKKDNLTIYRCPCYVPKNPNGLKRMALDFSFGFSAFIRLLPVLFEKKFDTVVCIAPPFHMGILAILYKKIKKAKFFYHIQDLQIEAAAQLNIIKFKKIIPILFRIEKYILNRADLVSSISKGMNKKIEQKINKPIFLFPNWVDTNFFFPVKNRSELKKTFGFTQTDKIILYSGALGEKQGVEIIMQVADKLRNEDTVKFIICGAGPYKEKLENVGRQLQLKNVLFYPVQALEKFNSFLNMADVHLIIQKADAADLVMPSKLTTILAVGGLAIVTANPDSSLYKDVERDQMGVLVDPENSIALKNGIMNALSTNADNDRLRLNARTYAENYLFIEKVLQKYARNF